jgi:hypothetical protein
VILAFTLLISCGRKSEPRETKESHDLPAQRNPVVEAPRYDSAGTNDDSIVEHAYLELTLQNNTDGQIDQTAIVFGKHSCTFGIVGKGASAGYLGWTHPVGTNLVVRWRDSANTQRQAQVDISLVYDRAVSAI